MKNISDAGYFETDIRRQSSARGSNYRKRKRKFLHKLMKSQKTPADLERFQRCPSDKKALVVQHPFGRLITMGTKTVELRTIRNISNNSKRVFIVESPELNEFQYRDDFDIPAFTKGRFIGSVIIDGCRELSDDDITPDLASKACLTFDSLKKWYHSKNGKKWCYELYCPRDFGQVGITARYENSNAGQIWRRTQYRPNSFF